MAIVRINLLPHREQRRQARQRQFVSLAAAMAVLSLAAILLVHGILKAQIDNQNSRNALLKTEIAKLDEQIKEIDRLREQIQAVISRKQVVETLQANRSEAVHLLDQLVRWRLSALDQADRPEGYAGRLRAVECACVDTDAQYRSVAMG
jgi:type IV pilus assembly protein PilN